MSLRVWLRPAVADDMAGLAALWHASASLPTVGPPVMPSPADLLARAQANFAGGWTVTLAVGADGMLCGFLALRLEDSVLDELFVRPDCLGMGIGAALLDHAKAAMPAGFSLFTATSNLRARRFYEKAGLKVLRDAPHPRTGHTVTYYGWRGSNQTGRPPCIDRR